MAFPFVLHENWVLEKGETEPGFLAALSDTKTDTNKAAHVMHYSDMAEIEPGLYPLAGDAAFGAVVDLRKANGSDAYWAGSVTVTVDSDTAWLSFPCMLSENIEANHGASIVLARMLSTGPATELDVVVKYDDTDGWLIGITEGGSSLTASDGSPIEPGVEYHVEVQFTPATGSGSTAQLYLADEEAAAALSSFTSATIDTLEIGAVAISGTIEHGYLVFGEVIVDDKQVFPVDTEDKSDRTFVIETDCHVFVGAGELVGAELEVNNSANTATFYDTDRGEDWRGHEVGELNSEIKCLTFDRDVTDGLYVQLSGTNPRLRVRTGDVELDTAEEVVEHGREIAESDPYRG